MSLGIPSLFPSRGELLASFSYTDLISGNSYITLNGGVTPASLKTYESYTTGDDANSTDADNAGNWIAQTFTIGNTGDNVNFYLTKVRIKSSNATFGATSTLEIQETTAGEPNGTIKLKIVGITKVIEGGANDWWEFDITDSVKNDGEALVAGTQYAFVYYKTAAGSEDIRMDDNDATYTGGVHLITSDSGANWTAQTGDDLIFEIKGTLVNPYVLSVASFISSYLTTTLDNNTASTDLDTEVGRVVFETTFNQSAIIDGIAFVSYKYTATDVDASVSKVELWHVRGATETKIGDAEAFVDDLTPSLQMDLTRTVIAPRDKIKLKIILNYLEATSITDMVLNHDPNTAGNEVILQLPFKIDL